MTSGWRAIFHVSSVGLTLYGLLFNVSLMCFWSWDMRQHLRVADQLLESYQREVQPLLEDLRTLRTILQAIPQQTTLMRQQLTWRIEDTCGPKR